MGADFTSVKHPHDCLCQKCCDVRREAWYRGISQSDLPQVHEFWAFLSALVFLVFLGLGFFRAHVLAVDAGAEADLSRRSARDAQFREWERETREEHLHDALRRKR